MAKAGTCSCYFCGSHALWSIWLAGEDELPEETFACELHARGHLRRAIVLPQEFDDSGEPDTTRDMAVDVVAPPH